MKTIKYSNQTLAFIAIPIIKTDIDALMYQCMADERLPVDVASWIEEDLDLEKSINRNMAASIAGLGPHWVKNGRLG